MKKIIFILSVLLGSVAYAQLPYPVDVTLNTIWTGTQKGSLSGSVTTYIPLSYEVFGQDLYLEPSIGILDVTFRPYARALLTVDGPFLTFRAGATMTDENAYAQIGASFCILSDACSQ